MRKRKKIKKLVNDLDVALIGLRELASFKNAEDFNGELWLGVYSLLCDIAEELERYVKIWNRK